MFDTDAIVHEVSLENLAEKGSLFAGDGDQLLEFGPVCHGDKTEDGHKGTKQDELEELPHEFDHEKEHKQSHEDCDESSHVTLLLE